MSKNKIPGAVTVLFLTALSSFLNADFLSAQDGAQGGQPDMEEMLQKEVERLESVLKLEDWQVFYVDSTLRHNYEGSMKEMQALQRSGVENSDLFYTVRDKWMLATENAYRKFFTPEQWDAYLKQGGAKIIKEREKRQEKTREATEGKKDRKQKK